ncbi:MAG: amino acid ABC transporter permease [Paralcaligenes sp.]
MHYHWDWSIFFTQAFPGQTYLDWVLQGFYMTVGVGLVSWIFALILGTVLGVVRTLPERAFNTAAAVYVEIFRSLPLLVQLFIWYYVIPEILPFGWGDYIKSLNPIAQQVVAVVMCLSIYTSVRIGEQVRAGIQSLPEGQTHAAFALGLTRYQTYRFILLPIAARVLMPPLTSEFLTIFKNSAVASLIGLLDLAAQGRQLVDYTSQPYESFIVVTVLYLVVNMLALGVMSLIEKKIRIPNISQEAK